MAPRTSPRADQLLAVINDYPGGIDINVLADETGVGKNNIHSLLEKHLAAGRCRIEMIRPANGKGRATKRYFPHSSATRQPQPAVGKNTGSSGPSPMAPPGAAATSSQPAASTAEAKGRGIGPAAPEPSMRKRSSPYFAIDSDGLILLDIPELPQAIKLTPETALALGDFMQFTTNLWRP